jgi:hypothetical protein
MGSKNEREEEMRKWCEERDRLELEIARGEVDQEVLGLACNSIQNDYNLRSRLRPA